MKDILGKTPFLLAAKMGHLAICELLIDFNNDKNSKDIKGQTPFHISAEEGHLEICKLVQALLEFRG